MLELVVRRARTPGGPQPVAFAPSGDGSLVRPANRYAGVCHAGSRAQLQECLELVTTSAARVLRAPDHGIRPGAGADLVRLDAAASFTRDLPILHRPGGTA